MQFAWALAYLYVERNREQARASMWYHVVLRSTYTHIWHHVTPQSLSNTWPPKPQQYVSPQSLCITWPQVGLIYFGAATKLVVGALLLKASNIYMYVCIYALTELI